MIAPRITRRHTPRVAKIAPRPAEPIYGYTGRIFWWTEQPKGVIDNYRRVEGLTQ